MTPYVKLLLKMLVKHLTRGSAKAWSDEMKNLYVIYDVLAEEAGPVFEAVNDAVAIRAYEQLTKEMPDRQRETFILNYVGSFNQETMEFSDNYVREVKIYE